MDKIFFPVIVTTLSFTRARTMASKKNKPMNFKPKNISIKYNVTQKCVHPYYIIQKPQASGTVETYV